MASSPDNYFYCSKCHNIFKDPVRLSCNHSCCRHCLRTWWVDKPLKRCPVCEMNMPPLNQDKDLCGILEEDCGERLCPLHLEKLTLFCQNHEEPVCLVCRDTRAHRNHTFSPINDAIPDLKGRLQKSVDLLKDRLMGLNKSKHQFATAAAHIRAQAQLTEMQIQSQFRRLHQFLQDEESARIQALKEEEWQKTKHMADKMAAIIRNIATLTETIRAAEEQLRVDDVSFVFAYKEEIIDNARRCVLIDIPNLGTKALLDQARHVGNMAFHIWNNMKKMVQFSPVILDPNTAHPELMMSEDLCSVGQTRRLNLPQNPERFQYKSRVLGWEGFSQGSHTWIVTVPDDLYWVIGVISESALGKDRNLTGFWDICVTNGNYIAYSGSGGCKALHVKRKVERVRVKLNFNKGKLSFYNADTGKVLHRFTHSFRERLFPYFETRSDVKVKILPLSKM